MAAENTDTDPSVKFTIGDEEYEMPDFLDLDLDEWAFVYDVSGVVLEDFSPIVKSKTLSQHEAARLERDRQAKLRHPNVLKAFACVGYRRAKPDAGPDEVQDVVGRVKMLPFLESMADEDDADDPTSASEQQRSSLRSEDDSSESSSSASPKSSDEPESELATTGTGG